MHACNTDRRDRASHVGRIDPVNAVLPRRTLALIRSNDWICVDGVDVGCHESFFFDRVMSRKFMSRKARRIFKQMATDRWSSPRSRLSRVIVQLRSGVKHVD
ncbi:hypothetical protein BRADI_3g41507v3 [Brachypodium distachyon]|uniref:Uncharacterized protein n=1 Tax=Brachypodium distachyon TaxID=15368 RepID=A0A2K2D2J0_BRADI|nr:hypothetical protein BRADI_3g41507v3 [Brachypodium distachyon]